MHHIFKPSTLALLMAIGTAEGCGNPQQDPAPVAVSDTAEPRTGPKATPDPGLPKSCPPAILNLLKSDDPSAKREAGKMLGALLRESWKSPLIEGKESAADRANLQADVLEKIALLGPAATQTITALEDILKQESPLRLKRQVLELLPKLGSVSARIGPALAHASRNPDLQAAAIQVLIQLQCDDKIAVAALGESLRNPALLKSSLMALGHLKDQAVIPAARFLYEVATSTQQPLETRLAAIEVIGKFSHAGVPNLSPLWNDADPAIRKASVKLGISESNLLIREDDPDVIAAAFEGLARPPIEPGHLAHVFEQALKKESLRSPVNQFLQAHPDKVVGTLLRLFKSESALIRNYSIDLFAALENTAPVIDDLRTTLSQSDDPALQTLAAIKLGEIPSDTDSQQLADSASKWISHPKLKPLVFALLTQLGTAAVPTLTGVTTDSRLDSTLKQQSLGILLRVPDAAKVAKPLLMESLKSEDTSTRHWSAVALVRLAGDDADAIESEVTPVLQDALKSADPVLIEATLETLRDKPKLGEVISGDIVALLAHSAPGVRLRTIEALSQIGAIAKMPDIINALKKLAADDSDAEVRKSAADAANKLEETQLKKTPGSNGQ